MGLNVADIKSHKTFEDDTVRIAKEEGFEHTDTYKLQLSSSREALNTNLCLSLKTLKSLYTYTHITTRIAVLGQHMTPKNDILGSFIHISSKTLIFQRKKN